MPRHDDAPARVPAPFPYIGLGLLDESSVEHHAGGWSARYLDQNGHLYLEVEVGAERAELREFDVDGKLTLHTWRESLQAAVLQHALVALDGNPSPLLRRLSQTGPLPVFIPGALSAEELHFTFCPAMAIVRVVVPTPLGAPLSAPLPGPVARRLGISTDEDAGSPRPGALFRFRPGEPSPRPEPIDLHVFSKPAILVPDLAFAIKAANRPLTSAEWRPYLEVDLSGRSARSWPAPPRIGNHDPVPYAIAPLQELGLPPS